MFSVMIPPISPKMQITEKAKNCVNKSGCHLKWKKRVVWFRRDVQHVKTTGLLVDEAVTHHTDEP